MPDMNFKLTSFINKMRNEEFMQLYLQLMELTKHYITTIEDEHLILLFGKMQKEEKHVKLLYGRLNKPSEIVNEKNEVHKNIKNKVKRISILLQASKLSSSDEERTNAMYVLEKLGHLMRLDKVSTMSEQSHTIAHIRKTIEEDAKLADTLLQLDLIQKVEMLYKWQEEFEQLRLQQSVESLKKSAIDKKAIRKNATEDLNRLFNLIELKYHITKDERWVAMGEEVKKTVKC